MPAKQNKLQQIKKLIDTAHVSIESARQLLSQVVGDTDDSAEVTAKAQAVGSVSQTEGEKIIEGIFDGQNMVGPDGKQYSVPANYASKSKLVLGDTLKLTITADGTFMYKQIGPVERQRVVGMLTKDDTTDEYRVVVGDTSYRVLLASVTYFKGEPGDEVVLLVPKGQASDWGAVENIIKAGTAAPQPTAPTTPAAGQPVEEIEDLG
ncbi:MAG: hypothetical protein HZC01_00510 [Candidatus Kerfeldbacteria bacterium]|nr:hypothetical protein [Candidatus Kerfeldbacteria bacterium]